MKQHGLTRGNAAPPRGVPLMNGEPAIFPINASAATDAHHAKLVDGLIDSLKSALHLAVTLAPRLRA